MSRVYSQVGPGLILVHAENLESYIFNVGFF